MQQPVRHNFGHHKFLLDSQYTSAILSLSFCSTGSQADLGVSWNLNGPEKARRSVMLYTHTADPAILFLNNTRAMSLNL